MAAQGHLTLEQAGRAYAAAHGVRGGAGGWLREYRPGGPVAGKPLFIQGWQNYGLHLVQRGAIDPQDDQGASVYRIKTTHGVRVRSAAQWARDARQYVLTGKEA